MHLHFTEFDLEIGPGDCSYDSVKVHSGYELLNTFCGDDVPGDITSSTNTLLVTFMSDLSKTRKGFRIEYWAKDIVPGRETRWR